MLINKNISLILLGCIVIATPVLAQNTLSLARANNQATVLLSGRTSGNFSLSSLGAMSTIPNSQGERKPCIGYGSPTPDHIIELKDPLPQLRLQVEARGSDTTIVIRGPQSDNLRCEFGTTSNRNAVLEGNDWKRGRYEVWIGTIDQGKRSDYSLSVIGGISQQ
jgi:hypothetical protein